MQDKHLVVIYPGGLAGGGTRAQIRGSFAGFQALARESGSELVTVWDSKSKLPKPTIDWGLTESCPAKRHQEARALAQELMGRHNPVLVYIFGYTSFMPWGFQPYIEQGLTVCWGDCSPPDTDSLGTSPSSRFFADGYKGTHGILYGWHNCLPKSRVPNNLASYQLTAQPFSGEEVKQMRAQRSRAEPKMNSSDKLQVVLSSSDIWDRAAIGAWMTEQQWKGTMTGTASLLQALSRLGENLDKRVQLFADPALPRELAQEARFIDLQLGRLPPDGYRRLILGADLMVCRGSHSVTSAECAAMGVSQMVLPMPADGYMNAEDFTEHVAEEDLCVVPVSAEPSDIMEGAKLLLAGGPGFAHRAKTEFDKVEAECNFFDALRALI